MLSNNIEGCVQRLEDRDFPSTVYQICDNLTLILSYFVCSLLSPGTLKDTFPTYIAAPV